MTTYFVSDTETRIPNHPPVERARGNKGLQPRSRHRGARSPEFHPKTRNLGVFRDIGRRGFTRLVQTGVPAILGSRFSPQRHDCSNRDRINAPMQGVALLDSHRPKLFFEIL